jgi:phosphoglycolate phosphatase-like HAD superfamily hydrolase
MLDRQPELLALDFDGVLCNGLLEYFQVAWQTHCALQHRADLNPPSDLAPAFYRLRPIIETGWEMPVLIQALEQGFTESELIQNWGSITPSILQENRWLAQDLATVLDAHRDQWIRSDLAGWLSLHQFYPGVVQRLQSLLNTSIQLVIISTKEARFIDQLLQQQGITLPTAQIIGKEAKRPKHQVLAELVQTLSTPQKLWFVEDRLKTLLRVQRQPELQGLQLYLAEWGYTTAFDRQQAAQTPNIGCLSLVNFLADFPEWPSSTQ